MDAMKHYKIEDNNHYIKFSISLWSKKHILVSVFDDFNLDYKNCTFKWYDEF